MHIAITGSTGQLGFELQQTRPEGIEIQPLNREQLDFSNLRRADLKAVLRPETSVIINAAAYTAVDKAESEADVAEAINATAVKTLSTYCADNNIQLIHISTDFVFEGNSSTPYTPDASKDPQSVYGATKSAGEDALYAANDKATCIRTSWVYSTHGNNFVKTMIRLMNERDNLGVVADQVGSPTYAGDLARFIWHNLEHGHHGLMHFSNEGQCSWYDFACAINLLGKQKQLITTDCQINPIETEQYPTPAKRPSFSLLDKKDTIEKTAGVSPHWLFALDAMLDKLKKNNNE